MSTSDSRTPRQILAQAEQTIRIMQGQCATPAEIAQALDDHALLTRTVRPALTPLPEGGAQ